MASYDDVNSAWGPALPLPPVTGKDSAKLFGKLVKKFGGRKIPVPWWAKSGRRVWAASKGTKTPLGTGLPRMVHDASHHVFSKLHPTMKTHSGRHAELELEMIKAVLEKGWHLPKAPPPKPSADEKVAAELAKVEGSIKRWTSKYRRAQTALRKLSAKQRNLQRRAAEAARSIFTQSNAVG
jgi:hypothetical protein